LLSSSSVESLDETVRPLQRFRSQHQSVLLTKPPPSTGFSNLNNLQQASQKQCDFRDVSTGQIRSKETMDEAVQPLQPIRGQQQSVLLTMPPASTSFSTNLDQTSQNQSDFRLLSTGRTTRSTTASAAQALVATGPKQKCKFCSGKFYKVAMNLHSCPKRPQAI
jgi:hypothetical protein